MGVCDLFDEAFDLYKSNFLLLLGATAIFYVPLQAVALYLLAPLAQAQSTILESSSNPDTQLVAQFIAQTLATALISGAIYSICSAPVIYIAGQRYLNKPVTIWRGYVEAGWRSIPLIVGVVLTAILSTIGLFLCILPGIYLSCRWIVLIQVVMLEPRPGPFRVLVRSFKLTLDYVWRIIGVLFLASMITVAISSAFEAVLGLVLSIIPFGILPGLSTLMENETLAGLVTAAFSGLLVAPFSLALMTVFYFDIRIRQEGYDMAIMADQLGLAVDSAATALPPALPPARPPKRKFWQRRQPGMGVR
jgi:hypothetical protein